MKAKRIIGCLAVTAVSSLLMSVASANEPSVGDAAASTARESPEKYWNFSELSKAPKWRAAPYPESQYPGMKAILVSGRGPGDSSAEFFCYTAFPEGQAPAGGWPGVVLVHGGGGTAFPNWVEEWRAAGFAVIAPDWYNRYPAPGLTNAAPSETSVPRGLLPGGKRQDHVAVVANLVLAHSLLRSLPEVNPARTVYVGLSWGSWYGSAVLALDPRFRGGVEIYCGDYNPRKKRIVDGRFLHAAKVPMYWVVSTNDRNVTPETSNAGFGECATFDGCTLVNDLTHSHRGFSFESVKRMAQYYAGIGKRLPRLGEVTLAGSRASAPVLDPGKGIALAKIAYTLSNAPKTFERPWQYADARVENGVVSADVPVGTVQFYLAAYEAESARHDLCGTTKFVTVKPLEGK